MQHELTIAKEKHSAEMDCDSAHPNSPSISLHAIPFSFSFLIRFMRNLSSVLKSALIIGAALGTAAFVWYKTRDEEEEKEEVKEEKVEEKEKKKEESDSQCSCSLWHSSIVIPLDVMVDLLNEVSDTMILVYVLNPFYQSPVATLRHDGYRYDTEGNGRRGGV